VASFDSVSSPTSESPSQDDLLARLAVDLGACDTGGPLSAREAELVTRALKIAPSPKTELHALRAQILSGEDPLGESFYALRSPQVRRQDGAVYTPTALVAPMVSWVIDQAPGRVVDAGAGSGRFAALVARELPDVQLVAIDSDPLATLMTRAALSALGHRRAIVLNGDYTKAALPKGAGRTAFVGNPPYVRHHVLTPAMKAWAQATAAKLGHSVSGLAGLHAYFFLATAQLGQPDDVGCFVTSAEWLDVNYGAIIRELIVGRLGGEAIHVLEPEALPFEKTATTAAITCFRLGQQPDTVRFRVVRSLETIGDLGTEGQPVARARLLEASRWSSFVRTRNAVPEGFVELGELCRVHRGAVTGSNATWVVRPGTIELPAEVLFPSVTRARELFAAGTTLSSAEQLKLVIDLPADLDVFNGENRKQVERFLRKARKAGVPSGYIAGSRRAWWSVGLRSPAPILATYMARRPPAFVRNLVDARHINIAHGLYPREQLPERALRRLADALATSITVAQGRTYAGGLTKFEPKEMERLPVPSPALLLA